MARRDDKIVIRYFAIPNANKNRGGYMPIIEVNGRLRGDHYGKGYDKADAELMAQADALEHAGRYLGDFRVTVRAADAKYAAAALARDVKHWAKKRNA